MMHGGKNIKFSEYETKNFTETQTYNVTNSKTRQKQTTVTHSPLAARFKACCLMLPTDRSRARIQRTNWYLSLTLCAHL